MEIVSQAVGWIGTFSIVFAYFLISTKKVTSSSKYYQLLNLFGAIFVGINVFYQHAWPAFVLQIIWGIIAIGSLLKK